MGEDKIRQEKNGFNAPVTVGFVGHIPIEFLQDLKKVVESIPEFDVIFFKTSSGRLWIKEGRDAY